MIRRPLRSTLFPYATLFCSEVSLPCCSMRLLCMFVHRWCRWTCATTLHVYWVPLRPILRGHPLDSCHSSTPSRPALLWRGIACLMLYEALMYVCSPLVQVDLPNTVDRLLGPLASFSA